ncbi:cysteine desulfurase [Clostridium tertium]|uniref:cysteine desulfurase n=1 Tax=Clostridium TaxID=1485 RepID=UPI00019B063D|nr:MULTISPECIES: cysteine desulfurase [Clostridium]EEH99023.1 cysteine desulfurase, SufS subfamily [Clostridium sp. 7_2_43FAA]MDB1955729.1 cysteine desulfurase [Clostridium tertium]MDB1957456.1 cysteine desulfurase [Clostridium tertium]MDB1961434.1 cysteine desulfurase [Clostridium tertium]MDB1966992.1 cysteine desulfurase [Clostridium tertium]
MNNRDFLKDFPTLNKERNGKRIVYLDSAATTQKPISVINSIKNYYEQSNANPHRGAYELSVLATEAYDEAREKVRKFINAKYREEIIFTKNATESFNLLAMSYGMTYINEGDEIVISIAEHHSNLIPWQQVAKARGAILKYMYTDENGELTEEEVRSKITEKTKIVSITHVSNALGTINPVKEIAEYAHSKGAIVIVDGAQSVPHMKVDVRDIDADFLVIAGHKLLAPMGIGVLYGKKELLEKMPPLMFGGDMVEYVYEQETTFNVLPYKFEAGTQNVEGAVGLSKAIDYLNEIGMDNIEKIEKELMTYAYEEMSKLEYVKIYGPKDIKKRGGVLSFEIDGVHPHDVASIFDTFGVCIRAGNHCAQPLMRYMGINSTSRASLYFYNTKEDVDRLIEAVKQTYDMFAKWR